MRCKGRTRVKTLNKVLKTVRIVVFQWHGYEVCYSLLNTIFLASFLTLGVMSKRPVLLSFTNGDIPEMSWSDIEITLVVVSKDS